MALRILHTNDLHGTLSGACFERLQELREGCDLYFDSGDIIKAGNLAIPLKPDQAWERLTELRCDASTIGNRETHVLESAFKKKLQGARHPLLCSNLRCRDGSRPLLRSLVVVHHDLRVGLFAVMVPMVTERMKTAAASAYLWDQPLPVAQEMVAELRGEVDLLIALTHIGHRSDLELAEKCPGIDVILGGHSHTVLEQPVRVGDTWVCQGGSHGKFAGIYEWDNVLSGGLVPLRS